MTIRDDEYHVGVWAAKTPDRPAVIEAETGRVITFAEYEAMSNRIAHLARRLGLKPDDHAVVLLENRFDYLPIFWGLIRAGLRVTPMPTHLTKGEIEYILADCKAKFFLTSSGLAPTATQLDLSRIPAEARMMIDGAARGFVDFSEALYGLPKTPIPDQREGIDMLYSSGTTGRPKGVRKPMPQGDFGVPPAILHKTAERFGFGEDTIYLHPSPLYHAAPLGYTLRIGRLGGCIVVMKKFDAEACLANIERYKVTHSQWVPTHFNRLLKLPEDTRASYDHSTLRCAIHAAAPCPHDIKRAMIDWWGPVIQEYYAGSESNGQCSITSEEWLARPGSVGQAKVGELHICDEAGRELPAGEIGTIYFGGGSTFEYHNDPEKTAGSRHPTQPWSTIGDVGYVDDEGYLYLTDRKSFMIVSGGVNIYPQEVEALLLTHPAVEDAAVFGVPNEDFGEEVKAVVQLKIGVPQSDAIAAELIGFCRANLSHVKCPRTLDFIRDMPRGDNGKLYKKVLREPYWRDKTPA
ncbi:AMP-binding protein [Pseudooceanicola sp. LIPI14-2-Ac024]|uniref:AMP-binding protein n=1 Tax=Pseudooceanicola sp. LIPI14-2-Ac024 TaxID=3344875 RepID=UPI0035CF0514